MENIAEEGGGAREAHIAARPHCYSARVQKGKDDAEMELMGLRNGAASWRSERRREKDARGKLSRASRETSRPCQILHQ